MPIQAPEDDSNGVRAALIDTVLIEREFLRLGTELVTDSFPREWYDLEAPDSIEVIEPIINPGGKSEQEVAQDLFRASSIIHAMRNIRIQECHLNLPSLGILDKDIPMLISILKKRPFIFTISLINNIGLTKEGLDQLVSYLETETWVAKLFLAECSIDDSTLEDYSRRINPNKQLEKILSWYSTGALDRILSLNQLKILLDMLIKRDADFAQVKNEGWCLWHYAAYYGHMHIILQLLVENIAISNTTDEQDTCVHIAAREKNMDMLRLLLDNSPQFDIHQKNLSGESGLSISFKNSCLTGVKMFLEYGANIKDVLDDPVYKGRALLDIVIEFFPESTDLFLSRGEKLTETAHEILTSQNTAHGSYNALYQQRKKELELCQAAFSNDLEVVIKLAKEAVDFTCVDENNISPFQHAIEQKNWQLASFIRYHDDEVLDNFRPLEEEEKCRLDAQRFMHQKRDKLALVGFLSSRTLQWDGGLEKFTKIRDIDYHYYYLFGNEQLKHTSFTRPLLQVIESIPNLSIIYDAKAKDITRVDPLSDKGTVGAFCRKRHSIHIAGRPDEDHRVVSGTVIHEMCHAACYILWNNECNPFAAPSPEERMFEDIYKQIKEEYEDTHTRRSLPELVIKAMKDYGSDKHKLELIVRVPQIIVVHGLEYTEFLCKRSEGFNKLVKYYRDVVLVKAINYLESIGPDGAPFQPLNYEQIIRERKITRVQAELRTILAQRKLFRQPLVYLSLAEKCCTLMIKQLMSLGLPEAEEPLRRKMAEKALFIRDCRNSIFARHNESRKLLESFQIHTEEIHQPISPVR